MIRQFPHFWNAVIVAFGSASLLAIVAFALWRPSGPPRALISPENQRVVAAAGQGKITAHYEILNTGGADLVLTDATTSCGCSVASIEPNRVGPGRSARVTVEGTPMPSGSKNVWIHVQSNSRPQSELTMRLTMVGSGAVPYVAFASDSVSFGAISNPGARETFFVETRERAGSEFWLTQPSCSLRPATLSGGLKSERPMGEGVVFRRYEFTLELKNLPDIGSFREEVAFRSSTKAAEPAFRIPVNGTIRPPVFAAPSTLYASFDRGQEPPKLTVALTANDPGYKLTADYETGIDKLVDVRQISQNDSRVVFDVHFTSHLDRSHSTNLVFHTNHPQSPTIRVPLTLQVSSP